ncbi:MAG: hypothetical protein M1422_01095 [Candidatus Thermoplasmatota archaeon]|jgi:hypothetical protein|nr:hypothetical protein [Candidatus Sysuiplasma jiujiangense]MBX8639343.1 hypothetical protein [Candidatus Sysuiplasma jiujiangense]MBX8641312.1 hypothetical protein [Candidatus Sysuiplasma jiujiangense]MCL4316855.1 hypothetical protein [Candidatus Thermoplasmatota archaeon]MCL5252574.1 hypothetical protein [Candidatus Thermoplasmatota archaeon]
MLGIKGWEVNTLEAKRFSQLGEKMVNVRIDHNSTVTAMNAVSNTDVSIEFRFTANYTGMGFIKIEGKITVSDDSRSPESVVKEWRQTGNMPTDFANAVHNAVMANCIPTALLVSRDLQLPPPVPLPQVDVGQQKQGNKSVKGMEVA